MDGTVPVAASRVAVLIAELGAIGVSARAGAGTGALSTSGAGRVTDSTTECVSVEPSAAVSVGILPRLTVDSVTRLAFRLGLGSAPTPS